jgi:hypothetical protein
VGTKGEFKIYTTSGTLMQTIQDSDLPTTYTSGSHGSLWNAQFNSDASVLCISQTDYARSPSTSDPGVLHFFTLQNGSYVLDQSVVDVIETGATGINPYFGVGVDYDPGSDRFVVTDSYRDITWHGTTNKSVGAALTFKKTNGVWAKEHLIIPDENSFSSSYSNTWDGWLFAFCASLANGRLAVPFHRYKGLSGTGNYVGSVEIYQLP